MILVMFKLLIFSIDNLHLFRQQTQKFNFLIFVVYFVYKDFQKVISPFLLEFILANLA